MISVYFDSKLIMMTPRPPSVSIHFLNFSPLNFSPPYFSSLSDCWIKNAKLVVLLDKKAFIAEHKHNIIGLLEERGVTWTHKTADVKAIWEHAILAGASK